MKKLIPLLLCLLMCGCAQQTPQPAATAPSLAETAPAVSLQPVTHYAPGHALEVQTEGALRVYPLTMRKVRGIRSLDDGILVFSGYGSTTLSLLTGDELLLEAQCTLDLELDPQDPSLQIHEDAISFYDPHTRQTVLLNRELEELRRIPADPSFTGSPILSQDQSTLYYCTSYAIRAWDLETGIHRTLKELSHSQQSLSGLHCADSVLQCTVRDDSDTYQLFLSTETGQLLSRQEGDFLLHTQDSAFYSSAPAAGLTLYLFSGADGQTQALYPRDWNASLFWLPAQHSAVTVSLRDDGVALEHYSLSTGLLDSAVTLPQLQSPKAVTCGSEDAVWLLVYDPATDQDVLYCWDTGRSSVSTPAVYTQVYSDIPDPAVLSECQTLISRIYDTYGIQVLIGEDALAVQPWDYTFEAETLSTVLLRELTLLEQSLGRYPQSVLTQTLSHFSSVNLCLVRQISGTPASGSLAAATGIQFLNEADAYLAIAVGKYAEQALHHELFHIMETHILNESTALDQWESLNPDSFSYLYGKDPNAQYALYTENDTRCFVDQYSMHSPKEDRARVFENALLPGREVLFETPVMQAKLTVLCQGIRDAFRLTRSPESFPWEQYLQTSMAWTE